MEKVAIYLRKSREDEEFKGETLARHEKMLTEYCARNKLTVVDTYKEVVSGERIENRPQMIALMDAVAGGSYDGVVCIEIERLSRGNPIDQMEILDVFKGSATKIYTLNKVYDLTKEDLDEEYFEFALFMSRREYKTIVRRLQRGRLQATKEGYFVGAVIPYGFDKVKVDKGFVLVPNKAEAEIINYIFNSYINGYSTSKIIYNLNLNGVKTRHGCEWTETGIRNVLRNKVYIGQIHSSKLNTWVDGKHEAIVDPATFETAQVKYDLKAPKVIKAHTMKNPLAGLVYCGYCGKPLQRTTSRHGHEYLRCNRNIRCKEVLSIRLDKLEPLLLTELKKELNNFNYFLENYNDKLAEKKESQESELKLLKHNLKQKEKQIEKACILLEQGVYSIDLFKKRTQKLEQEIEVIKESINNIDLTVTEDTKIRTAIPIIEKVLKKYNHLSVEQKNKLLKSIIKRISITKGEDYNIKVDLLI